MAADRPGLLMFVCTGKCPGFSQMDVKEAMKPLDIRDMSTGAAFEKAASALRDIGA